MTTGPATATPAPSTPLPGTAIDADPTAGRETLTARLHRLTRHDVRTWVAAADENTSARDYLTGLLGGTPPPTVIEQLALPIPDRWSPGSVSGSFRATARATLSVGIVFGGYQAAIGDHLAGLAMMTVLADGYDFVTSELDTKFRVPLAPEIVTTVEAELIEVARRLATVRVLLVQHGTVATSIDVLQVIAPQAGARS